MSCDRTFFPFNHSSQPSSLPRLASTATAAGTFTLRNKYVETRSLPSSIWTWPSVHSGRGRHTGWPSGDLACSSTACSGNRASENSRDFNGPVVFQTPSSTACDVNRWTTAARVAAIVSDQFDFLT